MAELLLAAVELYRNVLRKTARSFVTGWMTVVAVVLFAVLMVAASFLTAPLGFLGGFLLGAVNALLVGATLSLIEQAIRGSRDLTIRDIQESFGQYFWDVISVGFVLWIPIMVLDKATAANPNGPLLATAVFLLLFILLNPAPEVIYQARPGSPLEVLRKSYEFVLENWIEWFIPVALVVAPLGFSFFVGISDRLGRGAGLDFMQVLALPFSLLTAWLRYLGLSDTVSSAVVILLTPVATVAMLLFRGHLFAALHCSTHRKRMFQGRFGN
jgi:hypothetical protein